MMVNRITTMGPMSQTWLSLKNAMLILATIEGGLAKADLKIAETIAKETGAQVKVCNPVEGRTKDDVAKGTEGMSIYEAKFASSQGGPPLRAILEVKELIFGYGKERLTDGLSFSVPEGVALWRPSRLGGSSLYGHDGLGDCFGLSQERGAYDFFSYDSSRPCVYGDLPRLLEEDALKRGHWTLYDALRSRHCLL